MNNIANGNRNDPRFNKDSAFRNMERSLARKERARLIRNGTIRPAYMMQPQLMVKNEGQWVPQIVRIS